MILGFHHLVDDNWALLRYYAVSSTTCRVRLNVCRSMQTNSFMLIKISMDIQSANFHETMEYIFVNIYCIKFYHNQTKDV